MLKPPPTPLPVHAKQLSDQREQLQQAEARMLLAEETSLQLSQEVHVLKRALGMKKSQADGALDSQTKMAYQLAKVWPEVERTCWGCPGMGLTQPGPEPINYTENKNA